MSKLDDLIIQLFAPIVQYLGPTLLRFTPFRRVFVALVKRRFLVRAKNPNPDSRYPPGVQVDLAMMGIAIVNSVDRILSAQNVSPQFISNTFRFAGQYLRNSAQTRQKITEFNSENGTDPPGFLVVSPTNACNLRCVGCYADSGINREKLDWQVFDRILSEVKDLWGKQAVVISGGEPFAYRSDGKNLLDMIERHPDIIFMSYTNGTLITDKVADRLAELGNFSPAISVEGWRERTDARRGAGVFDQVLDTFSRLRDRGVPFGVSLTATRHNAEEILSQDFIDFLFEDQGAAYGWIFHYMPIGRSYTIDLMPTPQQRLWMWRRSWEIIREKQIFLADFWNHGTLSHGCISAGRYNGGGYMYIDWNGHVTPCVFVPYSPVNINNLYAEDKTLTDAWRESFFVEIRKWQEKYTHDNGKHGNWMTPCPIRDHNAEFRSWLRQYEPDPVDENAEQALMDPDYACGMDAYDEAYQALSGEIWEDQYLTQNKYKDGELIPLPEIKPAINKKIGEGIVLKE